MSSVAAGPSVASSSPSVHELTHCGAALLTGGTILELRVVPAMLDRFVFGLIQKRILIRWGLAQPA